MRSLGVALLATMIAGCPKNEGPAASTTAAATGSSAPPLIVGAAPSASGGPQSSAPPPVVGDPLRFIVIPAEVDAASAIRLETQKAKKDGRVVLVYVGATWCPPCARLHAALRTDPAKARLAGVTMLAFDADTDGDRLNALGYGSRYIPFFAVPRPDGRASDDKMDTSFKKSASGDEVVEQIAAFVARTRAK